MRLKKPCLRFLTKWLGLNVFLGPHLICVAPSAGCAEILGRRSRAVSLAVDGAEGIIDGRNNEEESDGLSGVNDVKVLWLVVS
jgi:hypothetical protein